MPRGVQVHGNVTIGRDVSICEPSEVNGTKSEVVIGDHCDIASFVVINVADSHKLCIGLASDIERWPITLAMTAGVAAFVYFVFERGLRVPFPPGQLFIWLS